MNAKTTKMTAIRNTSIGMIGDHELFVRIFDSLRLLRYTERRELATLRGASSSARSRPDNTLKTKREQQISQQKYFKTQPILLAVIVSLCRLDDDFEACSGPHSRLQRGQDLLI